MRRLLTFLVLICVLAAGPVAAQVDAPGADAPLAQRLEQLSRDIDIPAGLAVLGAKVEDVPILATNALKDACGLTNPRPASQAEIEAVFKAAF